MCYKNWLINYKQLLNIQTYELNFYSSRYEIVMRLGLTTLAEHKRRLELKYSL